MSKFKRKKTIFVAIIVLAVLISTFVFGSNKSTLDEKDIEKAAKAAMQVMPFFSEEYAKRSDDPAVIDDIVSGGEGVISVLVDQYTITYDMEQEMITRITSSEKGVPEGDKSPKELVSLSDDLIKTARDTIIKKADKMEKAVLNSDGLVDVTYELSVKGVTIPLGTICYKTNGTLFDAAFLKAPFVSFDDIEFAVSQEEAVEIARGAMISTLKDRGIDPAELGIEKLVPSATEKRVHYKTQKTCWRIEFTFEDEYYGANMFDIFVDTQNGDVVENANSFT